MCESQGHFFGIVAPALKKMVSEERPREWLSPSSAGGCMRQRVLRLEEDYYQDLYQSWVPSVGTAIHDWLSVQQDDDTLREHRLKMAVEHEGTTYYLSGQIDRYNPDTREILDFKTTRSFWGKKLPDPDHVLQLNLYAHLLEHHQHPVERMRLWYVKPEVVRKRDSGNYLVDSRLFDAPLWAPNERQAALDDLVTRHHDAFTKGLPEPYAPDHPKYYRCGWCPVRDACYARAMAGE